MIIYLGTDHRGFYLKENIKNFLKNLGYDVKDLGNFIYDEEDDYPDWVIPVARSVSLNLQNSRGIIFGFSGQGEAMAANRIKGVRAAVFYGGPEEIIKLSREHNNANILSLGAGFITIEEAQKAIKLWLEIPFSNEERHIRRINKIDSGI